MKGGDFELRMKREGQVENRNGRRKIPGKKEAIKVINFVAYQYSSWFQALCFVLFCFSHWDNLVLFVCFVFSSSVIHRGFSVTENPQT